MIAKCERHDMNKILSYIGNEYPSCLYLYLDLKQYGIASDIIDVYIQYDTNSITSLLLKYYSCLHVFSRDNNFNTTEFSRFVEIHTPSIIYCTSRTADRIYSALPKSLLENAVRTTGWVAQIDAVDQRSSGLPVSAQKEDFDQIVRLIYEDDEIGKAYDFDVLSRQLKERNQEGYARNIVIKEGDLVLAHACTNAETDRIAVVAELLVRKEYRRKGYATDIWRNICSQLLAEGKEVYSFYYSVESRMLHKKIGFREICNWSKIVFPNSVQLE